MGSERRADMRIPVEIYMTQFIDDRPFRSVVSDLSVTGLHASRLVEPMWRTSRIIQLEIPLPGQEDPLWATGEIVYDALDPFFHGTGIRFLTMAPFHEKMLNQWVEGAHKEVIRNMVDQVEAKLESSRPPMPYGLQSGGISTSPGPLGEMV